MWVDYSLNLQESTYVQSVQTHHTPCTHQVHGTHTLHTNTPTTQDTLIHRSSHKRLDDEMQSHRAHSQGVLKHTRSTFYIIHAESTYLGGVRYVTQHVRTQLLNGRSAEGRGYVW